MKVQGGKMVPTGGALKAMRSIQVATGDIYKAIDSANNGHGAMKQAASASTEPGIASQFARMEQALKQARESLQIALREGMAIENALKA